MSKQISPSWPLFDEREERALLEALRSGKWGGHGPVRDGFEAKLPQLEKQFGELHDARYAVPVVNGTMAITAALHALDVKPGDEVITTPYTFIATTTAALLYGVIPVFADIEEDTLLIDPEKIEPLITPRTKAIIAVHIGGAPANLARLRQIADQHGLALIEDAAQAVGAQWEGRGVGAVGDAGTFSFQSSKNLNAGEGGIILTNSADTWEKAWSFCNVGRIPEGGWYQHERFGLNLRMTEFQAAILLAQMTRLEEQLARREKNGQLLTSLLSEIKGIRILKRDPRITRHAWHIYMFRLDLGFTEPQQKLDFIHKLGNAGIGAAPGYVALNRNQAVLDKIRQWEGAERVNECPICERVAQNEVIWIGQQTLLHDESEMMRIAEKIGEVVRSYD